MSFLAGLSDAAQEPQEPVEAPEPSSAINWPLAGLGLAGLALTLLLAGRRGASSELGRMPRGWWNRKLPKDDRLCYGTKTDALNAFRDANRSIIEAYGGESIQVSPSEFDSINHKYDLTGKKAARTIAEALWAALPGSRKPYCLTDIDLEALNDTSPVKEAGQPFRLPDFAEERRLLQEQMELFREQAEEAGEEFPSSSCCRICWASQPCGNGCISKKRTCRTEDGCAGDDVSCPV